MPEPYRVGVAGLIHDHIWGMLRWWKELEGAELVAAADPNPPLLEKIRSEDRRRAALREPPPRCSTARSWTW